MKRLFWVGVGVGVSALVLRQIGKAQHRVGTLGHAISPAGLSESVASLATAAREMTEQLRTSMSEHEATLTAALLPSEEEQSRARTTRAHRERRSDPWSEGDSLDDL